MSLLLGYISKEGIYSQYLDSMRPLVTPGVAECLVLRLGGYLRLPTRLLVLPCPVQTGFDCGIFLFALAGKAARCLQHGNSPKLEDVDTRALRRRLLELTR